MARAHECFIDVRDFKGLRTTMLHALKICFPRAGRYFFPRVDDRLIAPLGFDDDGVQHERMMPGVFENASEEIIVGNARTGLAPFPWMPKGHWMSVRISDDKAYWAGVLLTGLRDEPSLNDRAVAHGIAVHAASLARVLFTAQEMQRLANTDALTGALSRRAFIERLAAAPEGMLFYVDLDGFKEVNDQQGHAAGDRLLIAVTQSIRNILRRSDFLGRLGGDEFALYVRIDEEEAMAFVDRVSGAVNRAQARASVGWAPFRGDAPAALAAADERMYDAKRLRPHRNAR